jgi:hypothetical protein
MSAIVGPRPSATIDNPAYQAFLALRVGSWWPRSCSASTSSPTC